jgi:hypothetical protein
MLALALVTLYCAVTVEATSTLELGDIYPTSIFIKKTVSLSVACWRFLLNLHAALTHHASRAGTPPPLIACKTRPDPSFLPDCVSMVMNGS